jgi:hypothetical protein
MRKDDRNKVLQCEIVETRVGRMTRDGHVSPHTQWNGVRVKLRLTQIRLEVKGIADGKMPVLR